MLFNFLARLKVYITRAMTYIGIINFILIFSTFKLIYNINISNFVLIPIGLTGALILGFLDYKLILKYETAHNNQQNDVKFQIERIEKKVDEIKKTLKQI